MPLRMQSRLWGMRAVWLLEPVVAHRNCDSGNCSFFNAWFRVIYCAALPVVPCTGVFRSCLGSAPPRTRLVFLTIPPRECVETSTQLFRLVQYNLNVLRTTCSWGAIVYAQNAATQGEKRRGRPSVGGSFCSETPNE